MQEIIHMQRTTTTFAKDGSFDEEAFRQYLNRFVESNIGIYLASGGSGEGHALTWDEMRHVYRVGVEVLKGKVNVCANQPEQYTARATIELAQLGIEAGVDALNVYGPSGSHAERANEAEYIAYFDRVLTEITYPVVIALNPYIGHFPKAPVLAALCNKYSHIVAVNVLPPSIGMLPDTYLLSLQDALTRDVPIYVHFVGAVPLLDMGAVGTLANESNIIPKTFRKFLDAYQARDIDEVTKQYSDIRRFSQFVLQFGGTPRWIKMAMKVLKLPGGEGGLREPFLMPDEAELQRFTEGILKLPLPEIDELARASGLRG
ncbi:MAG TPA: dihydrodipicolinate synthase family protein [Acidimicrobiales bacterium]|jgi:4-hydroxy-tetrahydrodipicolinate synthase|nr:dihydrodipicolinate synthase family protein [Acidimicrobiales bacterium]